MTGGQRGHIGAMRHFLQRDPLGYSGSAHQTWPRSTMPHRDDRSNRAPSLSWSDPNLYLYIACSPAVKTDPYGLIAPPTGSPYCLFSLIEPIQSWFGGCGPCLSAQQGAETPQTSCICQGLSVGGTTIFCQLLCYKCENKSDDPCPCIETTCKKVPLCPNCISAWCLCRA